MQAVVQLEARIVNQCSRVYLQKLNPEMSYELAIGVGGPERSLDLNSYQSLLDVTLASSQYGFTGLASTPLCGDA